MLRPFSIVVALALHLSPTSALVAHAPALRTVSTIAQARTACSPQMILGSGSVVRAVRRFAKVPRVPGFGAGGGRSGGGPNMGGGSGGIGDVRMGAEGEDDSESPLVKAWKRYEELLDQKPLLMKGLTSLVGFALGDILAQKFIQKTDSFDWARLFRLASFGFLVHGTTSHWFYGMLDGKIPGTNARAVFSKVFIDQVLWNPIFGVMFFTYIGALELKGIPHIVSKVQNDLITAVTGSWKVWPLAHAINFRFVPSSQRVLYINSIQIGYNCFLSMISNRD
jgi:protein Mpv17